jgi:hypothetical protein
MGEDSHLEAEYDDRYALDPYQDPDGFYDEYDEDEEEEEYYEDEEDED